MPSAETIFNHLKTGVWRFSTYYKYTFRYYGESHAYRMHIWFGGDAGDIYRLELAASQRFPHLELSDLSMYEIWDKKTKNLTWSALTPIERSEG